MMEPPPSDAFAVSANAAVAACLTPPSGPAAAPASIITVPVIQPQEGVYSYIAIRCILSGDDCTVFGMSMEERLALQKRFTFSSMDVPHGCVIKSNVFQVMNSLSKLGYKVVCSSGEKEITWTLQREI